MTVITSPVSGDLRNWTEYDSRLKRRGIPRRQIDLFHRDSQVFWAAVTEMRQAIDEIQPDILHTHAGTPTAVAVHARSGSTCPSVGMVSHFYSWGLGRPAWMNEMDLWAFRQADTVICSALAYREILRRGGVSTRRLRMLPWGISVPDRGASARGHRDVPIIGTVGRVERRKGQLELVNAFANLRRRRPDAILEIVGPIAEETYASSIRAAIRRHRLDESVRVTGHVTDPQALVARWSAYVSLSSDEGQGLAVLEAMANGVPVVALGVAGVEDYLTHARTGLVARSKNAREVAGLIDRVLVDRLLAGRLAKSARAMVRRRYGWTNTVAGIETAYHRLQRSSRERCTDALLVS